jgi:iron(III) transport system substrate-binding protein
MRYYFALVFWLLPQMLLAQVWEDQRVFQSTENGPILRIISSTDTAIFAPIVEAFIAKNPSVSVDYMVTGTKDVDRLFRQQPNAFDVVISSAMDLQLKLANDGFALRLDGVEHLEWAKWHDSLFAFTSEPAAIVINRAAFVGQNIPKTRQALIEALRRRSDFFHGRIGTYDVRQSGLGYLFATQDARATETYWRLMEVMGALDVRLYCCSGDMIDDLISGRIAVAYNVLASYAEARLEDRASLEIILPADFPTTMMRTAMVSAKTSYPEEAEAFIRHLVKQQSQPSSASGLLPPLKMQFTTQEPSTIALEPALMTFLDAFKRRKFLAEWEDAVIQR